MVIYVVLHAYVGPVIMGKPCPVHGEGEALYHDEMMVINFAHRLVQDVIEVKVDLSAILVRRSSRLVQKVIRGHGLIILIPLCYGLPQLYRLCLVLPVSVQIELRIISGMLVHVLGTVCPMQIQYGIQPVFFTHLHRPVQITEGIIAGVCFIIRYVPVCERYAHHIEPEAGYGLKIRLRYEVVHVDVLQLRCLLICEIRIGMHGIQAALLCVAACLKVSHTAQRHPVLLHEPVSEVNTIESHYLPISVIQIGAGSLHIPCGRVYGLRPVLVRIYAAQHSIPYDSHKQNRHYHGANHYNRYYSRIHSLSLPHTLPCPAAHYTILQPSGCILFRQMHSYARIFICTYSYTKLINYSIAS